MTSCEKNTVHLFDHPTQLQMVSANLKLQLNYLDHQFDLTRNKRVDHIKKDVHIMVQRAVIKSVRGCHGHGRDRIVVGFTSTFVISASVPITTNVVSSRILFIARCALLSLSVTCGRSVVFLWYSGFLHQ